MQRLRNGQGIVVAAALGIMLLGGMSYATAAEDAKRPAEKATPPAASKAPVVKKAPEKKPTSKGGEKKATPAAAPTTKAPAPKYSSAETAAKGQACYGEAPIIASMTPDEGTAGDKVTIAGKNFGPADCLRSVSFGPGYPATFKFESDTQITATVPSGKRKGLAMTTVTTASGEDSKVFVVK